MFDISVRTTIFYRTDSGIHCFTSAGSEVEVKDQQIQTACASREHYNTTYMYVLKCCVLCMANLFWVLFLSYKQRMTWA